MIPFELQFGIRSKMRWIWKRFNGSLVGRKIELKSVGKLQAKTFEKVKRKSGLLEESSCFEKLREDKRSENF